MKRVFRHSQLGVLVAALFVGGGIWLLIGALANFDALGVALNGVDRRDPIALAVPLFVCGSAAVVGFLLLLYARFSRIEAEDSGFVVYSLWNRPTQRIAWPDVQSVSRDRRASILASERSWKVVGPRGAIKLPPIHELGGFLGLLAAFVPRERWEPSTRISGDSSPIRSRLGDPRDRYTAFFSILWYSGLTYFEFDLAGMGDYTSIVNGVPQGTPRGWVHVTVGALAMALIPAPFFYDAWMRLLRGSIDADTERLVYSNGRKVIEMAWTEVRIVWKREIAGEEGYEELNFVTDDRCFAIRASGQTLLSLIRLASAATPESAHFYS